MSRAPYTLDERAKMTVCVGLTDVAQRIAEQKRRGQRIEDVKAYYAAGANARLFVPLVDKVYGATFTNAWDYAVSFFMECAREMASVSGGHVEPAAWCLQHGMIASVAHTDQAAGVPKEQTYERFTVLSGEAPRAIIDDVYARPRLRAQVVLDAWNRCVAPLSRR